MRNLTIRQIADYLSVTKRTVQRRAQREMWSYFEERGLGGRKRVYPFAELPESIRYKVIASIIASFELNKEHLMADASEAEACCADEDGEEANQSHEMLWMSRHCLTRKLDPTELNKSFIKYGLLSLAKLYISELGLSKIKGYDEFCSRFNARTLPINPGVYSIIWRVSRISLLRWEKAGIPQDVEFVKMMENAEFVDRVFEAKLKEMAEEVMMIAPNISAKRLRQHLQTFFTDKPVPSEHMIKRWMNDLKTTR